VEFKWVSSGVHLVNGPDVWLILRFVKWVSRFDIPASLLSYVKRAGEKRVRARRFG